MSGTPPSPWRLRERTETSVGAIATDRFGDGPPVILTHGTPVWSYLWREVAAELARTHTVHVWDLPGYGDSSLADGVGPSIAVHARALADLVEIWGLREPALVGHDIGGATVLRAHLLEGAPVRAFALIDAAILAPWLTPVAEHMQEHIEVYRGMPHTTFHAIAVAHLDSGTRPGLRATARSAYLERYAGVPGQQRWLDQVERFTEDDTRDVVARLGEIDVPTQVLWGAHDSWLPPETAVRLAERIPGAAHTVLDGAGHFTPEDAGGAVTRELRRLLARADSRSTV